MVDQFLGEIKLVGFNFAPIEWALCAGQIVSISQNSALFALLGTMYGGNGTTNFGLPDLQGRAAGHVGPNLYTVPGDEARHRDRVAEPRRNTHCTATPSTSALPGRPMPLWATTCRRVTPITGPHRRPADLYPGFGCERAAAEQRDHRPSAGGSQPHENMMPFLAMNYVIAMQGVFPPRG